MKGFRDLDPEEAEQVVTSRRRKKEYLDEMEAQLRAPKKPTGYDASPSERSVRPARRRQDTLYTEQRAVEERPVRRAETYRIDQEEDRFYVPSGRRGGYEAEDERYSARRYDTRVEEPYYPTGRFDAYAADPEYDDNDSWDGMGFDAEDTTEQWEDPYDDAPEEAYYDEPAPPVRRQRDRRDRDYADPYGVASDEESFFELDEEDRILRRGRRRVRAARARRLVLILSVLTVAALGLVIFATRRPKEEPQPERPAEIVMQGSNDQDLAENKNDETVVWNGEPQETEEPEAVPEEEHVPQGYLEPSADKEAFFAGYATNRTSDTQEIVDEEVQSSYAVLINAETGEIVAQRDAEVVTSPASMTKIMTLLVAVEHLTDLDETVVMTQEVGDVVYRQGLSAVGYQVGDVIPVRDLLYGTILPSGADAALLLAEHVAGSEEAFVAMMNDKVAELGLTSTCHFANPVGFFDQENKCTMVDMAMILKAAVENDLCRTILNTRIYTTSPTNTHPEGIEISNWFLRRIEDKDAHGEVMCAKTGFVDQSGCCAASYQVSNDGHHYFCVTGNAWSSWRCIYDHVRIYDLYTN